MITKAVIGKRYKVVENALNDHVTREFIGKIIICTKTIEHSTDIFIVEGRLENSESSDIWSFASSELNYCRQ